MSRQPLHTYDEPREPELTTIQPTSEPTTAARR